MTELVNARGQPITFSAARSPEEPTAGQAIGAGERDFFSECDWHCGPGGPLGVFERSAGFWLVVHGVSGQVVGCAESRGDALYLVNEQHTNAQREILERTRRWERIHENYDRRRRTL